MIPKLITRLKNLSLLLVLAISVLYCSSSETTITSSDESKPKEWYASTGFTQTDSTFSYIYGILAADSVTASYDVMQNGKAQFLHHIARTKARSEESPSYHTILSELSPSSVELGKSVWISSEGKGWLYQEFIMLRK